MIKFAPKKLQRIGRSLYLALPPAWHKTKDLKQGDLVETTLNSDGTLVVSVLEEN